MEPPIAAFDLKIRHQIFRTFADECRAPTYQELAGRFNAAPQIVRDSFHRLHQRHMIFLEPGADTVRIANPFSAIPTMYKVTSGNKQWWANCAWDALGIAAALDIDVQIEAGYPDEPQIAALEVKQGRVDGKKRVIYFPLPCRQWYDDLIFT